MREDMIRLTKAMIRIPSVNTTEGERKIGEFIEAYIKDIPYFIEHPDQVIVRELKDDPLHRRNVVAILIGEKENSGDTLLLHGHTDTVGLEGYGPLEEYAFDPDRLMEQMKNMKLPEEVEQDLISGDYLFGRGACDMKDGDAVFMGILKDACQHPEELKGNIVVSFNPVEENLHTGVIEATDILLELQKKYGLNYIMGINNDYICPLYPGDETKTIYTGMVGKLLPCFYIQGKETHVGQCFEGFDAALLAAGIVNKIHLNHKYSDGFEGEYAYPPSVLKMKDLKPWYNVQTVKEAFVYFNYFVHNASIDEITVKLKEAAEEVFVEALRTTHKEISKFTELSGEEFELPSYDCKVLTYEELYKMASVSQDFSSDRVEEILQEEMIKGTDKREIPIEIVRYLMNILKITSPTIVIYYAPPYCPHNTLKGESEKLIADIKTITEQVAKESGHEFRMMRFYPSLSDSSYLNIDDPVESVAYLVNNFPGFDTLFPLPLANIKKLSIPAVNFGGFGKDAHKWTERVNLPYTFEVLPKLIEKTIDFYLK
ncbi:MAG: M20/M25/M40 family metallo-hydrolase [Lachnospiraceae bacterium]|nr:M20/M25/M40 family metallo-hydrolase [Lachnospiraceae bacterium]